MGGWRASCQLQCFQLPAVGGNDPSKLQTNSNFPISFNVRTNTLSSPKLAPNKVNEIKTVVPLSFSSILKSALLFTGAATYLLSRMSALRSVACSCSVHPARKPNPGIISGRKGLMRLEIYNNATPASF